jgi:hypothetical protein
MTNEILNRRVLRSVTIAGKPVTCASIAIELGEHPKDIRSALHELMHDGFVIERRGLYECCSTEPNGPESAA